MTKAYKKTLKIYGILIGYRVFWRVKPAEDFVLDLRDLAAIGWSR